MSIVNSFTGKISFGHDSIPMCVIKKCIHNLAQPLCALINCSFRSCIFPDQLKVAKVCPIFKGGASNDFANYRPISVLPSFSKIFEKAVFNRLSKYISVNDILTPHQYGVRKTFSTYNALLDLHDKITDSIDIKKIGVGYFLIFPRRSILLIMIYYWGSWSIMVYEEFV